MTLFGNTGFHLPEHGERLTQLGDGGGGSGEEQGKLFGICVSIFYKLF